jgi:raffinose/stachyose/melibiose transport system permease protein
MKVFAIIFGTTGGGPLTTTESVQVLAYRIAFKQQGMSLSMAAMVIFAAVVLLIVIVFQRLSRERGPAA